MEEWRCPPFAICADTVTEYAIRLVNHLATQHGIANHYDIGDNISDLFLRQLVLPGRHESGSSHRWASPANDGLVVFRSAVLNHQIEFAVQLRRSRLAVAMLTMAEPTGSLKNDPAPDHWPGGFLVYGLTAVLPCGKCGHDPKTQPYHPKHDRSSPAHLFHLYGHFHLRVNGTLHFN